MSDQKNILVVDDNKPITRALEHKLTAAGFTVVVAENGEEGLKEVEEKSPDLVITDLIMPDMDGFDMLEKIDAEKIPVFVLSELSQEEDRKRAEKLGARKVFVKSDVQLSDVVDEVQKFVS